MNTYRVHLSNDSVSTETLIQAATPTEAIRLADNMFRLQPYRFVFEHFEPDCNANEIEVFDQEGNQLAKWQSDYLLLQLAAEDLLDAAELVVARWSNGDLADAVQKLSAVIAKATGGAQ